MLLVLLRARGCCKKNVLLLLLLLGKQKLLLLGKQKVLLGKERWFPVPRFQLLRLQVLWWYPPSSCILSKDRPLRKHQKRKATASETEERPSTCKPRPRVAAACVRRHTKY